MRQVNSSIPIGLVMALAICLHQIQLTPIWASTMNFEKMTNHRYNGSIYDSVPDVSLSSCLDLCKDNSSCSVATFTFYANPFILRQDTNCILQTATGEQTSSEKQATHQSGTNFYSFKKIFLEQNKLCSRRWLFERFPNKRLQLGSKNKFHASDRASCLEACLNEPLFICNSLEYNYLTKVCTLNTSNHRSLVATRDHQNQAFTTNSSKRNNLITAQATDYFENNCLLGEETCEGARVYERITGPGVGNFVRLSYLPDREKSFDSLEKCTAACTMEQNFLCKSILFENNNGLHGKPNCFLYHLDHTNLADGLAALRAQLSVRPLLAGEETQFVYLEMRCKAQPLTNLIGDGHPHQPPMGASAAGVKGNLALERVLGINGTIRNNHKIRRNPSGQTMFGGNPVGILNEGGLQQEEMKKLDGGRKNDVRKNCDSLGLCYEVTLECFEKQMVVGVRTQQPFFGKIYSLGAMNSCYENIRDRTEFRLNLNLTGHECNTKFVSGTYTGNIVLQHHIGVVTKPNKVFNLACTHETTTQSISYGTITVRDQMELFNSSGRSWDSVSIVAKYKQPMAKLSILTEDNVDATTVRTGDRLLFRISIPDNSSYGLFASSCLATAKGASNVFELIDEHGCPRQPSIFPGMRQVAGGNNLETIYDAFHLDGYTNVAFQCKVKFCIEKCQQVNCPIGGQLNMESWGRRKRSTLDHSAKLDAGHDDAIILRKEIIVLDNVPGDNQTRSGRLNRMLASSDEGRGMNILRPSNTKFFPNTPSNVVNIIYLFCLFLVVYLVVFFYTLSRLNNFRVQLSDNIQLHRQCNQ